MDDDGGDFVVSVEVEELDAGGGGHGWIVDPRPHVSEARRGAPVWYSLGG